MATKMTSTTENITSKAAARDKITESLRSLLSFKITVPLGNPNLKMVHTNQFITTRLPDDFVVENLWILGEKMNSSTNRYSGYTLNNWYVEGVTITNDGKNPKMELDLNPFASSLGSYKDDYLSFIKAYDDALKQSENSDVKTATMNVTGGEGDTIDKLVEGIIGSETDELKKAKLIHSWLQDNLGYGKYKNSKYSSPEECYNNRKHLNCADTSRLTASMMRSAGLNCKVVHSTCHYYTVITINGKEYCSDATSRQRGWNYYWKASSCTGGSSAKFTGSKCYYAECGDNPCS